MSALWMVVVLSSDQRGRAISFGTITPAPKARPSVTVVFYGELRANSDRADGEAEHFAAINVERQRGVIASGH